MGMGMGTIMMSSQLEMWMFVRKVCVVMDGDVGLLHYI